MALKACARAAPSALRGSTPDSRRPGLSGSIELITSVSLNRGDRTRRSRTRFKASISTTRPASSSASWSICDRGADRDRRERQQEEARRRAPRRSPGKPTTAATSGALALSQPPAPRRSTGNASGGRPRTDVCRAMSKSWARHRRAYPGCSTGTDRRRVAGSVDAIAYTSGVVGRTAWKLASLMGPA